MHSFWRDIFAKASTLDERFLSLDFWMGSEDKYEDFQADWIFFLSQYKWHSSSFSSLICDFSKKKIITLFFYFCTKWHSFASEWQI